MKHEVCNRTQPGPRKKNCGIRTRIVGVEGEHADHLTTTLGPPYYKVPIFFFIKSLD